MKNKSVVYEIALTGVLTALSIILGAFAHFPLFGSQVYLVGIVVLLMPLVLKYQFAIIGTIISIVLTDVITGWASYTWISIIAYSAAITIVWFMKQLKFKLFYVLGLLLGSIAIIVIYFSLMYAVIDRATAIDGTLANLVQFSIVFPVTSLLYTPLKIVSKLA